MSQINVDEILPFSGNGVRVSNLFLDLDDSLASVKIAYDGNPVKGNNNTYVGWGSGAAITPAAGSNTFLGMQSGANVTGGANNVLLGSSAGPSITTGFSNVMIGAGAGGATTGNNNVFIGHVAGQSTTTGTNNVIVGYQSFTATATTSDSITLGNSSHNVLRCAVTSITSLSDARDKKDVTDLRAGLDFVNKLRPVEFVWDDRNEEGKHDVADFGFLAQDLKETQEDAEMADVLKLVYDENPEKLEASYGKLLPIMVKAIQELSAELKALKAEK